MNSIQNSPKTLILAIHIQANAAKTEIVGWHDHHLKIRLTAPATEGQANKQLIFFLADYFAVAKKQVTILKGLHSKYKVVCIHSAQRNLDIINQQS